MDGLPLGQLLLVPHSPDWSARFAAEAERLRSRLGPLIGSVEHIGSTAVPGLLAKPVIDVAVSVASEAAADECIAPLAELGYAYRGQHGEDPSRRYYVLERDARRLIHLHLYIVPTPSWQRHLAFRDLLRDRPEMARAYAREKLRVAEEVGWSKAAYADAKAPFIDRLLREIGAVPGTVTKSDEVTALLRSLGHPRMAEIEEIRDLMLSADERVREEVKWNSPSFRITGHFATLKLRPGATVQVVFHTGAKARSAPLAIRIDDPDNLLTWPARDRCVAVFAEGTDFATWKPSLARIVQQWIQQTQ